MHLGISTFIISILVKASTDLVIKSLDGDRLGYRGIALKVETRCINVVGSEGIQSTEGMHPYVMTFHSNAYEASPFLIRSDKTRNVFPTSGLVQDTIMLRIR